jgi:cathepsin D
MFGPKSDVAEVYKHVGGVPLPANEGDDQYYAYPCDSPPVLSFSWGGNDWEISPEHFSFGPREEDPTMCTGTLAGSDDMGGIWLLGDTFMMNVYTAFSFEESGPFIGFSKLVTG